MADLTALFVCSWGDIRLFASSASWDGGRTQVVHDLAAGDDHPRQDRGRRLRKTRLSLLFDEFDGITESPFDAFRRFEAAVDAGERRLFTHPMDGSFFACVGDFEPTIDENSVVSGTAEFIPDSEVQAVAPAGAGTTGTSGEAAVSQAADLLDTELMTIGIGFPPAPKAKIDFTRPVNLAIDLAFSVDVDVEVDVSLSASANVSASATASAKLSASADASVQASATASVMAFASAYARAAAEADAEAVVDATASASASAFAFAYASAALSADARASVSSWNEEDVPPRKIAIDAARLSDGIATMIEVGGLETDLQMFPAYRAAILFGESIRSAAVAASSETATFFTMRVLQRSALLPLAARVYGGFEANDRARQISLLNDISTPGWLDPGDYLMPARSSGSQSSPGIA